MTSDARGTSPLSTFAARSLRYDDLLSREPSRAERLVVSRATRPGVGERCRTRQRISDREWSTPPCRTAAGKTIDLTSASKCVPSRAGLEAARANAFDHRGEDRVDAFEVADSAVRGHPKIDVRKRSSASWRTPFSRCRADLPDVGDEQSARRERAPRLARAARPTDAPS